MLAFIRRHPSVLTLFVVVLVLGVADAEFARQELGQEGVADGGQRALLAQVRGHPRV